MTCGSLGRSRKNFDGSGGNSHAVAHNKKTGHPLVVKMGTITPEGEASVFCYKCDDDVVDKNLVQHLIKFGIKVEGMEQTEKTILEMNIELNNNYNLSMTFEKGKKLKPIYGPFFTGMKNLGNTCYLNSVVQVLFSMPEIINRYYIPGLQHLDKC